MQFELRHLQNGPMARMAGITLLELMIVVIIVGILAAIAYPSYQGQVQKTRRADGKSALLDTAQRLERCYTRVASYAGCVTFPVTSPDGYYSVTTATLNASSFTLAAAPQGTQAGDTECGTLRLNSAGTQGSQGADTDTNECW